MSSTTEESHSPRLQQSNPLREFFDARTTGKGIWKWSHYFDIYHRHLNKFVGREVGVLEVGVYSGGSLEMWRAYFGPGCKVFGVDIEDACKVYENEHTKILIGNQGDKHFWRSVKDSIVPLDVVIDDGSHRPEDQIATLEELLPQLRPGGVYLCEDVHGEYNGFAAYAFGLVNSLNATSWSNRTEDSSGVIASRPSEFQTDTHSIHFYPYMVVIEKNALPMRELRAPRHGTEWQPFL